jgi:hypothetical protein
MFRTLLIATALVVGASMLAAGPAAASDKGKPSVAASLGVQLKTTPSGYRGWGSTRVGGRMGPQDIVINPDASNCTRYYDGSMACLINAYLTMPDWYTQVFYIWNANGTFHSRITCYTAKLGWGARYCYSG